MILTCLLILLITAGGTALTYLYEREDVLLARLAAGNIVGAALFATAGFVIASLFGLSAATILPALLLTLLPLLLFARKDYQKRLRRDRDRAKGNFQGRNFNKFFRFVYYLMIFIVLWLFFERALIVTDKGFFTGGSNNLGDLPFHLGAIFSFTEGQNFPPENPSYAFAKFTYPFLADFLTACFVKLGASVRDAMLVQNIFFGFSLAVLLEKFTIKLTNNKFAGKIAPPLLFLSGGLGFLWFFRDYWQGAQPFFAFLWKMPNDYTIGEILSTRNAAPAENFRWGNSLVTLFLTQRGLLFGMPLTIIALIKIWDIFSSEKAEQEKSERAPENSAAGFFTFSLFPFSVFFVGLLAGMLPLIHVHSLAVLFIVCAFLFFFKTEEKWREWLVFAAGVGIVAVPELIWVMTGSASNFKQFIDWHLGWDSGKQNLFVFWVKNTGLLIPFLLAGLYLAAREGRRPRAAAGGGSRQSGLGAQNSSLLIFYLPFAFLFFVSNTVKLAPWEWDNIKVLIYWLVGSIPFVAFVLARLRQSKTAGKVAAVVLFIALTLSGALDVWRTVSRQINYQVFSRDAILIAEQIKGKTAPNALFLNAPTYNSAIVLTGRRSLMRYSGHLSSYGIDYAEREAEVKRIYEGTAQADRLLQKNNIEYVIISPEETANLAVNQEFFAKFPVVAESGEYRVYKVKK